MKPFVALLVITAAAVAGDTFDDMLLRDGTVLKNVEVKEVTARGLKVAHRDGSGLIKTEQLPAEVKKRYAARIAAAAKAAPADKPVEPKEEPKPEKTGAAIPGLEPATVVQLCEKQGLKLSAGEGDAANKWTGSLKDDMAEISVTASGPNRESIAALTVTVVNTGAASGSDRARSVLGSLAAVTYTSAEPARAKQWVSDNIDTDGASATIGGVTFQIGARAGAAHTRSLRIALPQARP